MEDIIFTNIRIPLDEWSDELMNLYLPIHKKMSNLLQNDLKKLLIEIGRSKVFRASSMESLSPVVKNSLGGDYRDTMFSKSLFKQVISKYQTEELYKLAYRNYESKIMEIKRDLRRIAKEGLITSEGLTVDSLFGKSWYPPTIDELNSMLKDAYGHVIKNPLLTEQYERLVNKSKEFAEVAFGSTSILVIPEEQGEEGDDEVLEMKNENYNDGEEGSIFSTLDELRQMTSLSTNLIEENIEEEFIGEFDFSDEETYVPSHPYPPPPEEKKIEIFGSPQNLPKPFGKFSPLYGTIEHNDDGDNEENGYRRSVNHFDFVPEFQGYVQFPIHLMKFNADPRSTLFPLKFNIDVEGDQEVRQDLSLNFPVSNKAEIEKQLEKLAIVDLLFSQVLRVPFIQKPTIPVDYYYQSILLALDSIQRAGLSHHLQNSFTPSIIDAIIHPPRDEVPELHFIIDVYQTICSVAASALFLDVSIMSIIPYEQIPIVFESELLFFSQHDGSNSLLSFLLTIQSNLVEHMTHSDSLANELWSLMRLRALPLHIVEHPERYISGRNIKSVQGNYSLAYFQIDLENNYANLTPEIINQWWNEFGSKVDFFDSIELLEASIHFWHKLSLSKSFFTENDFLRKVNGEVICIRPDNVILKFLPQYLNLIDAKVTIIPPSEILIFAKDTSSSSFLPIEQNYIFPQVNNSKKGNLIQFNVNLIPRTTPLLPPISIRVKNDEGILPLLIQLLEKTEIKYLTPGTSILITILGIHSDTIHVSMKIWERESIIHHKDIFGILSYAHQFFSNLASKGIDIF